MGLFLYVNIESMSEVLQHVGTEIREKLHSTAEKIRQLFLGSQEQEKQTEDQSPEEVAKKVLQLFEELPLIYKRWATFTDVIGVMAGIKAVTDLNFLGETWNEDNFLILKEAFTSIGLQISSMHLIGKNAEDISQRRGYLYNPATLERVTKNSDLVPAYDRKIGIDEYLKKSEELGYHIGALTGKMYSFPESAIRDYLDYLELKGYQLDDRPRKTSALSFNETYWWYPPAEQDVLEREELKNNFMQKFMSIPEIEALYESDDLERSNQEWSQKLPKF